MVDNIHSCSQREEEKIYISNNKQIEMKDSMVIIETIYLGHQDDLSNQKKLSL